MVNASLRDGCREYRLRGVEGNPAGKRLELEGIDPCRRGPHARPGAGNNPRIRGAGGRTNRITQDNSGTVQDPGDP